MNVYLLPLMLEMDSRRNSGNAAPMKKYMKDRYEFLGVKTPDRKEITARFF